jgi:hypothetical protein
MGGEPVFEFGFRAENDTKLLFSVDEKLPSGKATAADNLLAQDAWTFVAATYDRDAAADQVCFYRGTEAVAVTLVNCDSYGGRNILRTSAVRFVVGGPARDSERSNDSTFGGSIDNVFVYVGDVLDVTELEKLRKD